ncbi:hypothetical protein I3842_06G026100 [Carya illinoinensis]|uniref:Uncharacterized protein n=1 Tax=Carya illinoinensis TaxID=32201 RepID=A0A922JHA6_CARIL|nr:hypothetical protein I3842_06G026100 [Carya illinoinensis]
MSFEPNKAIRCSLLMACHLWNSQEYGTGYYYLTTSCIIPRGKSHLCLKFKFMYIIQSHRLFQKVKFMERDRFKVLFDHKKFSSQTQNSHLIITTFSNSHIKYNK